MSASSFSSKVLFEFKDNEVPPFIRDCFIALISPFEKLFKDGQVLSRSLEGISNIPDPGIEPPYPFGFEFKKDWIEWIYLEIKTRLEHGVRYYNFLGEVLSNPLKKPEPIILFLRKFRKTDTMLEHFSEEPEVLLREIGASQVISGAFDYDTILRGKIERQFSSYPVLWIANPKDALSLSGYFTKEGKESHELNRNSHPFILTPMYSFQSWRESVEYLIKASDAIILANIAKEGGIREEQDLLYSLNAIDRTFVTNPENLDPSDSNIRVLDELTEETLHKLKGADSSFLEKLAGWGHWAGFESLEYASQYIATIDELWGIHLDSGKEISPGYFSCLYTALMALLIFRGELKAAGDFAYFLAHTISDKSVEKDIEFLRGRGEFHRQDIYAIDILLRTSSWYTKNDKLYRTIVGFDFLEGKIG